MHFLVRSANDRLYKTVIGRSYGVSTGERVRFAPSPTGSLHLGGLRTALFNYLLAQKTGGRLILRIEDTDQRRLQPGSVSSMIEDMTWVGIKFDEGPTSRNGNYGPYVQSERLVIYRSFAEQLLRDGAAYRCFCSKERLEGLRKRCEENKQPFKYDGRCKNSSFSQSENLYVVRLNVSHIMEKKQALPPKAIAVKDVVFGRYSVPQEQLDDIILIKADGFPTYHFASVVDDHCMEISTVFRGSEWLPSTPSHLLLYKAFCWEAPKFVHLPLLVNGDGSKLSKRQNSAFVKFYREQGYLPEALVNFVALLGWSPTNHRGSEVFTLPQLIEKVR